MSAAVAAPRWKRALDLVGVAILALPVALACVAVAIAVRTRLGSPVFFLQRRTGLNGRSFSLVKFRSLGSRPGASDEERMSDFGRWLRSTSLDELPELWNVLRGDMSLVGPRPLLPEYTPRYSAAQARRLSVPAGITGWAQVNGRNGLSWDDRFLLDLWYVDRMSPWLDLRILGMTVGQVLSRRGISHPGHATMGPFEGNG